MSYNNYETSYTSYGGGGGGGGGGGFMPEGSQNSPSKTRENGQDSLRPVTIKQILEAQPDGDSFNVDNNRLHHVTFVGQIRNIANQATNMTYKLDDGTGSIDAKKWTDPDAMESNPLAAKLIEGAYCRVWGKLNSFNNRRHVVAQIIRPVEDMNEVSYHMLDATAIHLYYTRGPPGQSDGAAQSHGGQSAAQQGGGRAAELSQYSKVAQRVYKYLQTIPQGDQGVHQQVIASALGLDTVDVAQAGDQLLAGGIIYTTMDDMTWAVLENEGE